MARVSAILVSLLALSLANAGLCQQTIAELATGNDSLSTLVEALDAAGLVETFSGEGTFTVFAPTNAAFDAYLETAGVTKDELLASPDLAKTLQYHVLGSEVMSADITNGMFATTLAELPIGFDLSDGVKIVHGATPKATVETADVDATNGVVHIIDTVLQFPNMTVAEMAAGSDALTTLVAALEAADLVGALGGDGPFTVFAPTDEAATATLEKLSMSAMQLLASSDLGAILQYHVTEGQVISSVLTEDMDITTLGNMTLPFVLEGDAEDLSILTLANVDTPDMLATNGVVHVVNKMMVPASVMGDDMGDGMGSGNGTMDDMMSTDDSSAWSASKATATVVSAVLMAAGIAAAL